MLCIDAARLRAVPISPVVHSLRALFPYTAKLASQRFLPLTCDCVASVPYNLTSYFSHPFRPQPPPPPQGATGSLHASRDAYASLVPPLAYGQWVLTRLTGATQCAAKDGTVEMETEDGTMELFQCPGELEKGAQSA